MRTGFSIIESEGILLGQFVPPGPRRNVRICFTTRNKGSSRGPWRSLNLSPGVGDRTEDVLSNQKKALGALGLGGVFFPTQVHGKVLLTAGEGPKGFVFGEEGDAAFSDLPGTAVGVMTADCLPVMLHHRESPVVAAVHAGWRGIESGILQASVELMISRWGFEARDVGAYIGPGIESCCYEVEEEIAGRIAKAAGGRGVIDVDGPKPRVSLRRAAENQLTGCGLQPDHIYGSGLCTSCNQDLFYSYRRDGQQTGRMAVIIVARDKE